MGKSILSTLKLDKSQKPTKIDTTTYRRNNLLAKLDDIIAVIEQVKEAVLAKELDNAIDAVATKKEK